LSIDEAFEIIDRVRMNGVDAEIGLCLLLSAADGEISEDELFALTTRVGHLLGDDFPLDRLGGLVENELRTIATLGADEYVSTLPLRITPERRMEALKAACKIACADGLSPEEEEMVRGAASALELDAEQVIPAIGYRDTVQAPRAPREPSFHSGHEDVPNDATRAIGEALRARGWKNPMQELEDAGIRLHGFGALALEYASPSGCLLRVEHHTCDGSLRLSVTDANDDGPDFAIHAGGRETDVCAALAGVQDELTLEGVHERVAEALGPHARVDVLRS
jgi:tellurite resistance protein